MADSLSSDGVAGRYANALFEVARDAGRLDAVERDAETLAAAYDDSDALRALAESPLYGRDDQRRGVVAVAEALELCDLVRNTAALMASKRRLFVLRETLAEFRRLVARHRGEIAADVTAARPLTDQQRAALAETLKAAVGRDVTLNVTVDEAIIGGLIVRVGSRMVDASVRTQLTRLQNSMKEAG